jgi:hypothetical protein
MERDTEVSHFPDEKKAEVVYKCPFTYCYIKLKKD